MLPKTAVDEGKDWDKLVPYVLFACRELPQESTGFSPFELLYGWEVRGPLDVVKETWEDDGQEDLSVLSYVLSMREKKMSTLVQENLSKAQSTQYDRKARERKFVVGNQVLALLPTSTTKLLAQWQGPYQVIGVKGNVNYVSWYA